MVKLRKRHMRSSSGGDSSSGGGSSTALSIHIPRDRSEVVHSPEG